MINLVMTLYVSFCSTLVCKPKTYFVPNLIVLCFIIFKPISFVLLFFKPITAPHVAYIPVSQPVVNQPIMVVPGSAAVVPGVYQTAGILYLIVYKFKQIVIIN